MIFVDTSALYAVLDRADENHPRARAQWAELMGGEGVILTSNYVLVEMSALVQHRLGMEALRALSDDVVPALEVHWITAEEHGDALHAALAANRRQLSLVDCSSFRVMRNRGVRCAFTFDPHFAEQGFEVLPLLRAKKPGRLPARPPRS